MKLLILPALSATAWLLLLHFLAGCSSSQERIVHRLGAVWVDTEQNVVMVEYIRQRVSDSDVIFALPHHQGVDTRYEEISRDVVTWDLGGGTVVRTGKILSDTETPGYKTFVGFSDSYNLWSEDALAGQLALPPSESAGICIQERECFHWFPDRRTVLLVDKIYDVRLRRVVRDFGRERGFNDFWQRKQALLQKMVHGTAMLVEVEVIKDPYQFFAFGLLRECVGEELLAQVNQVLYFNASRDETKIVEISAATASHLQPIGSSMQIVSVENVPYLVAAYRRLASDEAAYGICDTNLTYLKTNLLTGQSEPVDQSYMSLGEEPVAGAKNFTLSFDSEEGLALTLIDRANAKRMTMLLVLPPALRSTQKMNVLEHCLSSTNEC